MAYLLTHFWPGATEEEYFTTLDAVKEAAGGEVPEIVHASGPTDGGILIIAVYESKESADRFLSETLMPLLPIEGGMAGPPEQREAEIAYGKGFAA
jgi:hypothetical protein